MFGDGPLLDLACGTGWWLERLARRGVAPARLFGLDLSAERVAGARRRVPGATIVEGDARAVPWDDDTFAAVFLLLSLSSLGGDAAVRAALAEARRVVRPGGVVAVWEPRLPTPWNRSTRWIPRRALRAVLGPESSSHAITLLPAVARRLGPRTERLYPRLARGPLRTHRLTAWHR